MTLWKVVRSRLALTLACGAAAIGVQWCGASAAQAVTLPATPCESGDYAQDPSTLVPARSTNARTVNGSTPEVLRFLLAQRLVQFSSRRTAQSGSARRNSQVVSGGNERSLTG